jgi:branched-chain amino acid transport system permease protein
LVRSGCDFWFASMWTNAVVFALLIAVLLFRPSGLLGTRVREKV